MTDRSDDWSARRRPGRRSGSSRRSSRAPERKDALLDDQRRRRSSGSTVRGRSPDGRSARDIGFPGEPPFTRGIHPTGYRSRLWTMRMFAGLRRRRGHQRPLPPAPRGRADGPVDRLRHADAVRLRHRRPRGRGRVRDMRRRRLQPRRHGGPARRPAARADLDVDDDQLAGRPDLGDVHRRGREGRRAPRAASRARPRTTSSRSSSPRRSTSSRRRRRCAS